MPGEVVGNNQNQGTETNNSADAWEAMADEVRQGQQEEVETLSAEVIDNATGRVLTDTKAVVRPIVGDVGESTHESVVREDARGVEQTVPAVFDQDAYRTAVLSAESETSVSESRDIKDTQDAGAEVSSASKEETENATEATGRERLDAWRESIKGTPEEYWQRLREQKRENGVELGEMPDLKKVDKAIQNFFENGLVGVTGKAREVREEMAKKAILNDIAKLKERGGELNDETMRNVFYGTQRMLEEMYRGNRELREGAQDEKLSPDEEIAWHLKMEPRKAKMNVLLVMQQHTRKANETDDAYEARLRNYAEDTPEHEEQKKKDAEYNAAHPEDAAVYAAQVLKNGQKDDLPEFTYLKWEEVNGGEVAEAKAEVPVEREGRVGRLFEKIRERVGFRNVVEGVKAKLADMVVGAVMWAEKVLTEEGEGNETAVVNAAEVESETEREKQLRQLGAAKAEAERRMARSSGNSQEMLRWAQLVVRLNEKMNELEAA